MSESYELIAAEKADPTSPFGVVLMCAVLGVSTSAFYDWLTRAPSARQRRRAKITVHVQAAFEAGRGTYGVRRVHAILARSYDPEVASASLRIVRDIWPRTTYTPASRGRTGPPRSATRTLRRRSGTTCT